MEPHNGLLVLLGLVLEGLDLAGDLVLVFGVLVSQVLELTLQIFDLSLGLA